MPRSIVSVPADVWTDLGTGQMVITIHKEGSGRGMVLNNSQDIPSGLLVPKGRAGEQFLNNTLNDTISAYGYGDGWEVAVDID